MTDIDQINEINKIFRERNKSVNDNILFLNKISSLLLYPIDHDVQGHFLELHFVFKSIASELEEFYESDLYLHRNDNKRNQRKASARRKAIGKRLTDYLGITHGHKPAQFNTIDIFNSMNIHLEDGCNLTQASFEVASEIEDKQGIDTVNGETILKAYRKVIKQIEYLESTLMSGIEDPVLRRESAKSLLATGFNFDYIDNINLPKL